MHKSLGLLHLDILREITVKKCILHVYMMEFPSLGFCNSKCQLYGIHIRYWIKGLIIVNTMNLLKAFGDKPGFVFVDLSICCALGLVDPYAFDKFPPRMKENQIPTPVLEEGFVLLLHGRFPKEISNSLTIRLWI
jgi:hypothetical protein